MRVHFTHLGCKLNQAEVERLAREFAAAGHVVVGSLADADLHVVNSCTVTRLAAHDSRKAAGRARRRGLPARTVLTGCHAAVEAPAAGVDLVVPNAEKHRLLDLVHAAFPDAVPDVPDTAPAAPCAFPPLAHTRALVKVEDGCNMRCAFCVIPSTRGPQRSRPLPEVVAEVRDLVRRGHREVVLTGVQISAYRWSGARLAELVRAILRQTDVPRLRLTSIAPWDLDGGLLDLWSDRRLCRHLHLSLQSGSTATLRRMRRPYTAAGYLDLLARVRAAVPDAAVTTDVIVGFPGEDEAEMAESLATVERAGFAKVHVFPYSPRPGTEAEALPDPVSPEAIRARMAAMLAAASRAERAFQRAQLGKRATVLWERPRQGIGRGLTDNYLRVLCPEGAVLRNHFSEVELAALTADGIAGRIVA